MCATTGQFASRIIVIMNRAPRLTLAALVLIIACAACTSTPAKQQYQKNGLQFTYNSEWKVAKETPVPGSPDFRTINIEGPNNAVVILICEPASSSHTLDEFAAEMANGRGAAIEEELRRGSLKTGTVSKGTSEPTVEQVAGRQRQGILQRFNIYVPGAQVPHEAKFYSISGSRQKIMIMSQVATEHAAESHSGFELILSTMSIEGLR
jgi:hypothetical protein